jgi:lipid II:glycine glycyltransferase (peptidoglycan interpeptide bridge formation enzyme)
MHWGIVSRLRELGLRRYDLGGVDAKRNPGVFEFKRRMGGTLVELPAKRLLCAPLLGDFQDDGTDES